MKFEGGRELEKLLLEMGRTSAMRVGRVALRKAANAILKDARARVPVNEGRLRKALRVRIDRAKTERQLLSALIYVSATAFDYRPRKTGRKTVIRKKRNPYQKVDPGYTYQIGSRPDIYGRFIEYGAPGHGVAPRPFLRPAWAAQGGVTALVLLKRELAAGIVEEARKLRARG
ncbi:MAG: HK97 gp10 family phage protein [Novosphingobium sp.]|nr:HK97 gp10 family phage protein [Novosphingobium sp.]